MVRIVLGGFLIALFLIRLTSMIVGGYWAAIKIFLPGGGLIVALPGALLVWWGWRARKRTACMSCRAPVKVTDASKLLVSNQDITSAAYSYGAMCRTCKALVHYKCCRFTTEIERGVTVKTGTCPQCAKPVLIFFPK